MRIERRCCFIASFDDKFKLKQLELKKLKLYQAYQAAELEFLLFENKVLLADLAEAEAEAAALEE